LSASRAYAPAETWIASRPLAHLNNFDILKSIAFLALAVPGIALAVLTRLTVQEPPRGAVDIASREDTASLVETLQFIGRQRSLLHVLAAGTIVTYWGWGLLWWTPAGGLLGTITVSEGRSELSGRFTTFAQRGGRFALTSSGRGCNGDCLVLLILLGESLSYEQVCSIALSASWLGCYAGSP